MIQYSTTKKRIQGFHCLQRPFVLQYCLLVDVSRGERKVVEANAFFIAHLHTYAYLLSIDTYLYSCIV